MIMHFRKEGIKAKTNEEIKRNILTNTGEIKEALR